MTRQNDNMDEQRYFTIQRDVDLVKQNVCAMEKQINTVILRQDRHEEKITECIEKLTHIVINVDKKIDVSLAQSAAKSGLWEKFMQLGPIIIIAVISGFWSYNSKLESKLDDLNNTPPIVPLQDKIYQKR